MRSNLSHLRDPHVPTRTNRRSIGSDRRTFDRDPALACASAGSRRAHRVGGGRRVLAERASSQGVRESSTILRHATRSRRLLWNAESGVRAYLLARDSSAATRTRTATDSLALALAALHELFAQSPDRLARLREFDAAYALWDSTFARPTFATGTLTREIALAGTIAYDRATAILDELVDSESELRFRRLDRQALIA